MTEMKTLGLSFCQTEPTNRIAHEFPRMTSTVFDKYTKKIKNFNVIATDGSVGDKGAKFAVVLNNEGQQYVRNVLFNQTSTNAELEAIELALKIAPLTNNLLLLVDSKSAIEGISNWHKKNINVKRKISHAHTINRIIKELNNRTGKVKFDWIPSHTITNHLKRKRESVIAQINHLCNEYGTNNAKLFIKMNDWADKLACTKSHVNEPSRCVPSGTELWVIEHNNKPILGDLYKYIQSIQVRKHIINLEHNSQKKGRNRSNLLLPQSSFTLQSPLKRRIKDWLLRVRTNTLPLNSLQHQRSKTTGRVYAYQLRNQIMYPDHFCSLCKDARMELEEDYAHFCTCPSSDTIIDIDYHTNRIIWETLTNRKTDKLDKYNSLANGNNIFCKFKRKKKNPPSDNDIEMAKLGSDQKNDRIPDYKIERWYMTTYSDKNVKYKYRGSMGYVTKELTNDISLKTGATFKVAKTIANKLNNMYILALYLRYRHRCSETINLKKQNNTFMPSHFIKWESNFGRIWEEFQQYPIIDHINNIPIIEINRYDETPGRGVCIPIVDTRQLEEIT
jgi:ribonuclease HI